MARLTVALMEEVESATLRILAGALVAVGGSPCQHVELWQEALHRSEPHKTEQNSSLQEHSPLLPDRSEPQKERLAR